MSNVENFDPRQLPAPLPAPVPTPVAAPRPARSGLYLTGGALALFLAAIALGGWKHHSRQLETLATAEQHRAFVPTVRVATVGAAG